MRANGWTAARGVALLSALALAISLACDGGRAFEAPHTKEPASTPLVIELAGCAHVPRANVCELDREAQELTLFVPKRVAELLVDGRTVTPVASQTVQDGTRVRVRLRDAARALEVRAEGARARVRLTRSSVPARVAELRALRKRGELAAMAAHLDAWEAELRAESDEAARCDRARVLGLRARLAFSRGEPQQVDAAYAQSIPALLACGRLSEAVDDAMAQAYTRYEQLRDFEGARATLTHIAAQAGPYAWGAASVAYHQAFLAMRLGDLGRALAHLDVAERGAERLDLADLRSIALQLRSWVLSLLGQHAAAAEAIEAARALSAAGSACERATLLTNLGWQRVLAKEAGETSVGDARAPLTESVALLDAACGDRGLRAHALINLARLAISEGSLEEAARNLARAKADAPPGDGAVGVALLDVQGRLLLDAGRAREALTVYEELSARVRAAGESLPVGSVGRAKALLALGRRERAVEALRESEDELELQLATVSLAAGRESLSLGRAESAHLLVQTLLALGREDEAFLAARRARARLLWSLQRQSSHADELPAMERRARDQAVSDYHALRTSMDALAKTAWTLPKDELERAEHTQREHRRRLRALLEDLFPAMRVRPLPRAPADGELLLGLFPLGAETFVFVAGAEQLEARAFASVAPPRQLLADVDAKLLAARTISVIAPSQGPLARVHTLEVAGEPLGLARPLSYVVDVPRASVARAGTRELFVIDPRGDLRGARDEAALLSKRRAAGEDTWLVGPAATRERVLAAFADAKLMHYAGHAAYEPEALWESGLTLSDRSTLTISDVLAAPSVPRHVVLAACATAQARAARHVATLGIAQAFIAAGAEDVIATLERIDDAAAFAFTRAYHVDADGPPDALRFHRAARRLAAAGLAWDGFVRLVP